MYFHVGAHRTHANAVPLKNTVLNRAPSLIMPPVIDNIHTDTIPVSYPKTIRANTHNELTIQSFTFYLHTLKFPHYIQLNSTKKGFNYDGTSS